MALKIGLIGYGKMGKMVEQAARQKGVVIAAIVKSASELTHDAVKYADVCIEFTTPTSAIDNIKKLIEYKKQIVVGTTGWYDRLDEIKQPIEQQKIGLLYTPNFSLGVNLMIKLTEIATKWLDPFPEYDIGGYESHHQAKKDSPAGTCHFLAEGILKNSTRKKKLVYDPIHRAKQPDEVHFASLRCGSMPGTYSVFFDAPEGTVTISHAARDRSGYAAGAVLAAEWIKDKQGLYTFNDLLKSIW
jgi:4-hydroxy-tetrahydrodipicolinate reductase